MIFANPFTINTRKQQGYATSIVCEYLLLCFNSFTRLNTNSKKQQMTVNVHPINSGKMSCYL